MTTSEENRLKIISWNVNGIRARMPRIAEMLRRERPDMVCLQETRCPFRHFPHQRLEQLGYRAEHSPGRRNGGVAILVRSDHRVTRRCLSLDSRHDLAGGRCRADVQRHYQFPARVPFMGDKLGGIFLLPVAARDEMGQSSLHPQQCKASSGVPL